MWKTNGLWERESWGKENEPYSHYPYRVDEKFECHFVLPYGKEVIRTKTSVMATLMAFRWHISLALAALGCIYHGLREVASHPNHPSKANTMFPSHYLIGWLVELFPYLYHYFLYCDCPRDFPTMVVMLECLLVDFYFPSLDMFSGIEDIFLLGLAHIAKTLIMAKVFLTWG